MKDGDILKVSIDVENIGKRPGSEVVQLYVSDKDSTVPRAVKELKGFAKVFLNPGEKKTVTMELCARDFAYPQNISILHFYRREFHIAVAEFRI